MVVLWGHPNKNQLYAFYIVEKKMEKSEVENWALKNGFRQTGSNAYSAHHEGVQYQIVLKKDRFISQRVFKGHTENMSNTDYQLMEIDEFGMLQGAGLSEAFVRKIWHNDSSAPIWFTKEYHDHAINHMIPKWEEAVSAYRPVRM